MTPFQMFVNFLHAHNIISDDNPLVTMFGNSDQTDVIGASLQWIFNSITNRIAFVFSSIFAFFNNFVSSMHDDFAAMGEKVVNSFASIKPLDSSIFTDNFFFFVIGFIVFVFLLKIAIDIIIAILGAIISLIP